LSYLTGPKELQSAGIAGFGMGPEKSTLSESEYSSYPFLEAMHAPTGFSMGYAKN
jgi:hypothetical protein